MYTNEQIAQDNLNAALGDVAIELLDCLTDLMEIVGPEILQHTPAIKARCDAVIAKANGAA